MKTLNSFLKDKKKMMLVDGDLLAYKVASALEEPTDWGHDQWTLHCDFGIAKQIFGQNLKYCINLKQVRNCQYPLKKLGVFLVIQKILKK